jgi:hypothetical protein
VRKEIAEAELEDDRVMVPMHISTTHREVVWIPIQDMNRQVYMGIVIWRHQSSKDKRGILSHLTTWPVYEAHF